MNIFKYKGKIFVVQKLDELSEPPKIQQDRLWFMIKNIESGSIDYIDNVSHVYMNHKHYNLQYDQKIMNELANYKPSH